MKFLFLVVLMFSVQSFSQTCKEDSAKLCPGLSGDELSKCMRKNVMQGSDACKAEMKAKKEARQAEMNAKKEAREANRKACVEKTKDLWAKRDLELKFADDRMKIVVAAKDKDARKKIQEERVAIRKQYNLLKKEIIECKN